MSGQGSSKRAVNSQERIPFVDLAAQHTALGHELERALARVLERADFILGEEVECFEREFAKYCGTRHAVGVASGTDALHLALVAAGVGPGDEVVTCAHTFIATAFAVMACGAVPVLVDADPRFYTIDVEQAERALTPRTRAILPVHLYGQSADMGPILDLARRRGLAVVSDACQAHGAQYEGRSCAALGDAAAFSFYPAKNLGACGDGGAVVTDRSDVAERVRLLRNYGQRAKNEHLVPGSNSRLDTVQAAVLQVKLSHLGRWNLRRREIAGTYARCLAAADVELPQVAGYGTHVFHLYVVRTQRRAALLRALDEANIACGIHYPTPLHLHVALNHLGYVEGQFPVAERLATEVLSLPMYPELTNEQIERVARVCCGA